MIAPKGSASRSRTRELILDDTQRLIQTRGYTNFSYADIATTLAVTTATIHYHFPAKADLGLATIARYRQRLAEHLEQTARDSDGFPEQFSGFLQMYTALIEDDYLLCPGVMLAAEIESLPEAIRHEVSGFFTDQEQWLAGKIRHIVSSSPGVDIDEWCVGIARHTVAALEGGLILSRLTNDAERFKSAVQCVLSDLRRAFAEVGIDDAAFGGASLADSVPSNARSAPGATRIDVGRDRVSAEE